MTLRSIFSEIWGNWALMLISFILLWAVVFVAQTVGAWYRLRHFKGPFPAAFSNIWMMRAVMNGGMHWDFLEANRKYGMFPRGTLQFRYDCDRTLQGPLLALVQTCW